MGQSASRKELSPGQLGVEGNPHIWIQPPVYCTEFFFSTRMKFEHSKPASMSTVDRIVWNDFIVHMDPLVASLNAGMRYLVIGHLALVFFLIMLCALPGVAKHVFHFKFFFFWLLPVILSFLMGYYYITMKNLEIDEEIGQTCHLFDDRFEEQGFSVSYRTQYTKFLKPRGAIPVRAIVFPPYLGNLMRDFEGRRPTIPIRSKSASASFDRPFSATTVGSLRPSTAGSIRSAHAFSESERSSVNASRPSTAGSFRSLDEIEERPFERPLPLHSRALTANARVESSPSPKREETIDFQDWGMQTEKTIKEKEKKQTGNMMDENEIAKEIFKEEKLDLEAWGVGSSSGESK